MLLRVMLGIRFASQGVLLRLTHFDESIRFFGLSRRGGPCARRRAGVAATPLVPARERAQGPSLRHARYGRSPRCGLLFTFVHDASVEQVHGALGVARKTRVVRHHHDG